jgi:hypothetical protein
VTLKHCPRAYCTYFDSYYLRRGLALYQSLCHCDENFVLYALCLDEVSLSTVRALALPKLHPISLSELCEFDPELAAVRGNRDTVEFYFTCSPCLPRFLLAREPSLMSLSYLDADLFFFSDPQAMFEEIGDANIAVIEHRFSQNTQEQIALYGRFNVGLVYFRRGLEADRCLARWREQCLQWCGERAEDGRFGDQKYLDEWPQHYAGVHVVQHPGANLAPWNLASHQVRIKKTERSRNRKNALILVDEQPLVFFHFHRTQRVFLRFHYSALAGSKVRVSTAIKAIFKKYVEALAHTETKTHGLGDTINLQLSQRTKQAHASATRQALQRARIIAQHWLRGELLWL